MVAKPFAGAVLMTRKNSVIAPKWRLDVRFAAFFFEVVAECQCVVSRIIPTALIFRGPPFGNRFGWRQGAQTDRPPDQPGAGRN